MTLVQRIEQATVRMEQRTAALNRRTAAKRRDLERVAEVRRAGGPERPRWGRRTFSDREPRPLTSDDVSDFEKASGEGRDRARKALEKAYPSELQDVDRSAFIKYMTRKNRTRMARFGADVDWLRSEARKYGINPEEIRWLL